MLYTVRCTPTPQTEAMWVIDVHPLSSGSAASLLPADPPAVDMLRWLYWTHTTPCDTPNVCASEKDPLRSCPFTLVYIPPCHNPMSGVQVAPSVCPMGKGTACSRQRWWCWWRGCWQCPIWCAAALPSLHTVSPFLVKLSWVFYASSQGDLFFASKISVITCNSLITL